MNLRYLFVVVAGLLVAVNGSSLRGSPEELGEDVVVIDHNEGRILRRRNRDRRNRGRRNRHHPQPYKKTAAQKRQDQRDRRREWMNPDRTWEEERRERERKDRQARRRGNRRGDPYHRDYGDPNYARKRERSRARRCRNRGVDCRWHALEYDYWDDSYDYDPIHDEHYPD